MSSQKKEDVLAAALQLVSQHGFHGTSMSMIADEANCGAGTIYNYFPSKDALMKALYIQIKHEFIQMILQDITPEMNLKARFFTNWRNIIQYYLQFPDRVTFTQQFYYSPYFDQSTVEQMNAIMAPLVLPYEMAMQQGFIKPMPLPVLETLTLDMASSLARRHIKGEILLDEELINATAEMCWSAIRKDKIDRKD